MLLVLHQPTWGAAPANLGFWALLQQPVHCECLLRDLVLEQCAGASMSVNSWSLPGNLTGHTKAGPG